jgi:hypothetical protein
LIPGAHHGNMTDPFILTVDYKGQTQDFNAQLLLQGYSHKFQVTVGDMELFFEPDEEGHYRAILMPWQQEKDLKKIDKLLLSEIQQKIEEILA